MKPLLLAGALSLFTTLSIHAQDNAPSHPQPDSIIKIIPFGQGRYTGYLYTIGGRLQTLEDVKLRLLSYAPSATEFVKAKNNHTWTYITLGAFAVSAFAAAVEFKNNNKYAGETTGIVNATPTFIYQDHNLTGAYLLTAAATGFLVSSIITLVNSNRHSKEALRLYNRRFE